MKRFLIWSLAGVCLAGSACTQNDAEELPAPQEPTRTERFYLSDETTERAADPSSRAYFSDGYKIAWETGDQVAINRGDTYPVQQDADGKWYVDLPAAESYTVYYPAAQYGGNYLSADFLCASLRYEQTFRSGSFDPASLIACAEAKPGGKLVFKYMTSVIKLTLRGTDAERVTGINLTTEGLGAEYISGMGKVQTDEDGQTSLVTMTGYYLNYHKYYVNLSADSVPLTAGGVDFYMVVFPTTFSQGFQLTVTLADGRTMTRKGGVGQTAARGRILAMPALRFEETDAASPLYYSTDNLNWHAWKYDTDGVTPLALAYPETKEHMLYFKDNAAATNPGLTAAHLKSLYATFLIHGDRYATSSVVAVQPVGFDLSRTTYESQTLPENVFTRWGEAVDTRVGLDLRYVSLPQNIAVVPAYSFFGNAVLREVVLPATVKEIGEYAFYMTQGFINSTDNPDISSNGIYCHATTPPTLGQSAFSGIKPTPFHVPATSLAAYRTAWDADATNAGTNQTTLVGDL
ncbi:hypothetical protein [Alistipes sp.]|uniref:hypothetical protein n=1 Tax=Alistipes sp. TaxID=1872444 RepID=UPI003AF0778C